MSDKRTYVVDTNVLLSDSDCLVTLRNGQQNDVVIPFNVLLELDSLKTNKKLGHLARRAIKAITDNYQNLTILKNSKELHETKDLEILQEILIYKKESNTEPIFITNDTMLSVFSKDNGIETEMYKSSQPFISCSEKYTGIVKDMSEIYENCFVYYEGKPNFINTQFGTKIINHTNKAIGITPLNDYQNFALELMKTEHIDVVTLQSEAGLGKSTLALAAALELLFYSKKGYDKIYITKPTIEVGGSLGFLPGDIQEKVAPYMLYLHSLLKKLHKKEPKIKEIFRSKNMDKLEFNDDKFEILPTQYIRGMDIEDSIVIMDEVQNMTREEVRTYLTRMGKNTKVFCLGDTHQIDHPFLNEHNNGLNWIVKKFINSPNYGHMVLKGKKSRGPVCDLVIKTGL